MMFVFSTLVIFTVIRTLETRQSDIDINRIRLLPQGVHRFDRHYDSERRSIPRPYQLRTNDYDDHSSWHPESLAPPLHLHDVTVFDPKYTTSSKIHGPREDPRLFYQSEAYIKENRGQHAPEVSMIYPGNDVGLASENIRRPLPIRLRSSEQNLLTDGFNPCVRCPRERTLIAKSGKSRVLLQKPNLYTCSGQPVPRHVHFDHMYGPKFDSFLDKGSHIIVGRILYRNKILHLCKLQIHVITQGCPTPKKLIPHCGDRMKPCNFTCKDPRHVLHGASSLICGDDRKWAGDLPICRVRTWCDPLSPPEHGRVSCKGALASSGPGLIQGSKCRVRCARGWRPALRSIAVCRRGVWTLKLMCQPIKMYYGAKNK